MVLIDGGTIAIPTDNITNWRNSLLRELAISENLSQGFCSAPDRATCERLKQTLEKARREAGGRR